MSSLKSQIIEMTNVIYMAHLEVRILPQRKINEKADINLHGELENKVKKYASGGWQAWHHLLTWTGEKEESNFF